MTAQTQRNPHQSYTAQSAPDRRGRGEASAGKSIAGAARQAGLGGRLAQPIAGLDARYSRIRGIFGLSFLMAGALSRGEQMQQAECTQVRSARSAAARPSSEGGTVIPSSLAVHIRERA